MSEGEKFIFETTPSGSPVVFWTHPPAPGFWENPQKLSWWQRLSKIISQFFMAKKQKKKEVKKRPGVFTGEQFNEFLGEFMKLRGVIKSNTSELREMRRGKIPDPIGDCAACGKTLGKDDLVIIEEPPVVSPEPGLSSIPSVSGSGPTVQRFVNFVKCSSCRAAYCSVIHTNAFGADGSTFESEVDTAIEFKKFFEAPVVSVDDVLEVVGALRSGLFDDRVAEQAKAKK